MTTNTDEESFTHETVKYKYKVVPPDGGWGYVITLGIAVMFMVTVSPLSSFGIIYGKYLSQIGDEASNTTTLNCIYNSTICFMGLVANYLLQNYSRRFVGILGSVFFFLGNFCSVFAKSITQLIISYGLFQGIGFGIMVCAAYASFNDYFDKKNKFMMGVSQTIVAAVGMLIPLFSRWLMDQYGYRGTVAIFSALSLHTVAAMLTLQPVERHLKKIRLSECEMLDLISETTENIDNKLKKHFDIPCENISFIDSNLKEEKTKMTHVAENAAAGCNPNLSDNKKNSTKCWQWLYKFLELSLLVDPKYVNISVGLSVTFLSDMIFQSLLPMFLNHLNYGAADVTYLVTLFMISDLVGRILLSIFTAFIQMNSRYLLLIGVLTVAILRIAFTFTTSLTWITLLCILLGVFRCFIQILLPIVLAEYSKDNFPAAYGMYSTICGIISLTFGPLSGAVASMTGSDTCVLHMLTILLLICGITWICELAFMPFRLCKYLHK